MKKILFLSFIIVLIASVVYYVKNPKKVDIEVVKQAYPENVTTPTQNNSNVSSKVTIKPTQNQNPVSTNLIENAKNCGSAKEEIFNIILPNNTYIPTEEDKKTVNCFDASIRECSPAIMTTTREFNAEESKILGKSGDNCLVSNIDYGKNVKTCKIPENIIASAAKVNADVGGVKVISLTILTMMSLPGSGHPGILPIGKDENGDIKYLTLDCTY
jgi:hypothetical protein